MAPSAAECRSAFLWSCTLNKKRPGEVVSRNGALQNLVSTLLVLSLSYKGGSEGKELVRFCGAGEFFCFVMGLFFLGGGEGLSIFVCSFVFIVVCLLHAV